MGKEKTGEGTLPDRWGQRGGQAKPSLRELPPIWNHQLKDSCRTSQETHRAQIFSVIGGTNHIPQHQRGDSGRIWDFLQAKSRYILVVHDKHLGLLQLWGQRGVGCGGSPVGWELTPVPLNASSRGLSLQHPRLGHSPSRLQALLHLALPLWCGPCLTSFNSLKLFSKITFLWESFAFEPSRIQA